MKRNSFPYPMLCRRQGAQKPVDAPASLPVPTIHQTTNRPITAAQLIPAPGSTREGFGGEKAA
ncbi:hypothetical protein, partial [uncultured Victivallis sp.]|uniref:hypothetical protein n=1 Tax=uncultured Victivallis sp. TaxID=354118 RepID=UPI0025FBFBB8